MNDKARERIVADAAEAVERFGEDELERFAEEHREEFGREGSARRETALEAT